MTNYNFFYNLFLRTLGCNPLIIIHLVNNLTLDDFRLVLAILLQRVHRAVEVVVELHLVPRHERDVDALWDSTDHAHVVHQVTPAFP